MNRAEDGTGSSAAGTAAAGTQDDQVVWDRLERLASQVADCRRPGTAHPRTAKLLAAGVPKMAQKLVEEAAEVAIEAVRGERSALIRETADLLYNLTVMLVGAGVAPTEIWAEMDRREVMLGIAEKLPKAGAPPES